MGIDQARAVGEWEISISVIYRNRLKSKVAIYVQPSTELKE
jgi:hypothetical protein